MKNEYFLLMRTKEPFTIQFRLAIVYTENNIKIHNCVTFMAVPKIDLFDILCYNNR